MATNFVWRVLIATAADAAQPTVPNLGSEIADITGWTAIGSRDRGDSGDLDSDSVTMTPFDEVGEVMAPVSICRDDVVPFKNGIDEIGFTCYDASETVIALASDISVTSHVATKTLTTVKRSVVIEVNGLYYDYFPNVELSLVDFPGGLVDVSKLVFKGRVCKGTSITSGWNRKQYQAA